MPAQQPADERERGNEKPEHLPVGPLYLASCGVVVRIPRVEPVADQGGGNPVEAQHAKGQPEWELRRHGEKDGEEGDEHSKRD